LAFHVHTNLVKDKTAAVIGIFKRLKFTVTTNDL